MSSSDHRCITRLMCCAGRTGLHKVSLLESDDNADCPPVSPLSMTLCLPERRRACASAFPWPPSRSWCRLGGSQGETSSCSVARTVACGCRPPRMSSTEPPGGSPPWQGKTRTMWRGAFFAKNYRTLRKTKTKISHTLLKDMLYTALSFSTRPNRWLLLLTCLIFLHFLTLHPQIKQSSSL